MQKVFPDIEIKGKESKNEKYIYIRLLQMCGVKYALTKYTRIILKCTGKLRNLFFLLKEAFCLRGIEYYKYFSNKRMCLVPYLKLCKIKNDDKISSFFNFFSVDF